MRINATTSFILTALMVQAWSQGIAAETMRQDQSIVKIADAYLKAVLVGDASAVGATLRDDAVEMPPCRPLLKGRVAIEQYYRGLFQGPAKITAFTFSGVDAASAGDLGYAAGTYERKLSRGPAGSMDDTGKFVVIVKRTGSAWKAAYVIYNSDHQPENPGAAVLAVPSPQHDLLALFGYYAGLARERMVRAGLFGLGAVCLMLIAALVRALRQRDGLRNNRQTLLSGIRGTA